MAGMDVPSRQVRAVYDAEAITVYQAFGAQIAGPAAAEGRFPAAFKRERMTWIKPSFLWMMYRCGWGSKPGQERVLAIRVTRAGFEWALAHAAVAHFDSAVHTDRDQWRAGLRAPVRVQWDPERDLHLRALAHRSLQVGLSGEAVRRYCDEWIVGIEDVTDLAHRVHEAVRGGDGLKAEELLPRELPYPLPLEVARVIGASR